MRFTRRGEFDIVTRISGPLHHYLGLRLHRDRAGGLPDLTVEDLSLPTRHEPHGAPVNEARLIAEVSEGLQAANQRLGTRYRVDGLRYCSSDPYSSGVYRMLTEELVEHVARRESRSSPSGAVVDLDQRGDREPFDRIADESFHEYDTREATNPGG